MVVTTLLVDEVVEVASLNDAGGLSMVTVELSERTFLSAPYGFLRLDRAPAPTDPVLFE
jgi:hypothetical protein